MISDIEINKAFDYVSINKIKKKIKEFKKNNHTYKDVELLDRIKDVLLFDVNGFGLSIFTSAAREYQISSQLFRIRKFEQHTISEKDLWEPPNDKVDYGRFNKPKESFLYATIGDFETPKKEVGITNGDYYIIIYYNVIETLSLFELGFKNVNIPNTKETTKKKIELLNEFIRKSVLSRKSGAYRISSILSNDIANFQEFDGWCYPSMHNNNAVNTCIKSSSKFKLKIKSIFLCQACSDRDKYFYSMTIGTDSIIQCFSDWNEENSRAYEILNQVYDDNKKVQKITVPENNRPLS